MEKLVRLVDYNLTTTQQQRQQFSSNANPQRIKKLKAVSPGNCGGNNMVYFRFRMNSNTMHVCTPEVGAFRRI